MSKRGFSYIDSHSVINLITDWEKILLMREEEIEIGKRRNNDSFLPKGMKPTDSKHRKTFSQKDLLKETLRV